MGNKLKKPNNERTKLLKGFAERLASIMSERGYKSTRASSGASTIEIAKAIGCTAQMANRYLMGASLPTASSLKKLAKWLKVEPFWLLYGNKESLDKTSLDQELLINILVEFHPLKDSMSPQLLADHIVKIYDGLVKIKERNEQKNLLKMMIELLKKREKGAASSP